MRSREFKSDDIPYALTLRPTNKEFSDFNSYIKKIEQQYSADYGMVKVIPPKNWKARQSDYEESLDNQMIYGPIEQNPYGKGGIYECIHIMKKSIPFREYKKKARDFDKVTEGKSIEKVEELFWKNISFSPPLYGSDMQMSLFDEGVQWSLKDLQSVLSDGLSSKISGVNTPYLYIGSWKTLFAWHKEDLDLGAINFLHYGKPKFWYCIARDDAGKLESMAKQNFAENFAKCSQFLRHKTIVLNPYNLVKKWDNDIKISKIAQEEGEFVIVFSGAYHHGFNWGYNIAEAVNYASLSWLEYFPASKPCRCTKDNVNIDHKEFIENLLRKRPELKDASQVRSFKNWLKTGQNFEVLSEGSSTTNEDQIMTKEQEVDDTQSNSQKITIECQDSQLQTPKQTPKKRGRKPKTQSEKNSLLVQTIEKTSKGIVKQKGKVGRPAKQNSTVISKVVSKIFRKKRSATPN